MSSNKEDKLETKEKTVMVSHCSHCGGTCLLKVHVKDGDMVRVFNDRGEVLLPAKVTERITPGVVDIPVGAWYAPDENGVDKGGCANVLTKDEHSPVGAYPSNTSLVQVNNLSRNA